MTITTDSLFDLHSLRIQEIINRSIHVFLAEIDPVWRDLIVTSQGVGNKTELGRDLKLIKVFMGSFTGVMDSGGAHDYFNLYGDLTAHMGEQMHFQQLNRTYPDPTTGPNATPYRLAVDMRSMPANIMLTLGEKTAEATPAFIGQVIAPKLLGFGRMMAHTLANYFFLSQNNAYILCTVAATLSVITTITVGSRTVHRFSFSPNNSATHRFARGQRIDIYPTGTGIRRNDSNGVAADQTPGTRENLLVESVTHLTNVVTVIAEDDPTTWQGGIAIIGDRIVYANTKLLGIANDFEGIAGIRSWAKTGTGGDDNFLLGSERDATDFIDVTIHPEFLSFLKTVNGVLTEHKLRQYLRRCHAAWGGMGHYIDCLIASDGVWMAYESQKIGMQRLDRTGRLSSLQNEGSEEGVSYTFDGRTYMGYTSTLVESGTLYGIKKGGQNWKKYVPPSPAGVTKNSQTEQYVPFEFVAGAITGTGSNQLPIYLSNAAASGMTPSLVTEGSQMPGRIRMQMVPDTPNMMILDELTEDRIYSDTS